MMNRLSTALVFTILCVSTCNISFADKSIRTAHFEVLHEGVGAPYAEIASRSAERRFKKITEILAHTPR